LLYEAAPGVLTSNDCRDSNSNQKMPLLSIFADAALAHLASHHTAFVLYSDGVSWLQGPAESERQSVLGNVQNGPDTRLRLGGSLDLDGNGLIQPEA
jgi:hypothetical protein